MLDKQSKIINKNFKVLKGNIKELNDDIKLLEQDMNKKLTSNDLKKSEEKLGSKLLYTNNVLELKNKEDKTISSVQITAGSNVEHATEDKAGILEIAKQDEVTAGTNDAKAVTPKKLKQNNYNKTETDNLLNTKQNITDNTLVTSSKTVVGAVNELDAKIRDIQLFKFPDATIIGAPTINNGQVSGFSSANYLVLPFTFDTKDRAFEINLAFTTGSNVSTTQNLLGGNYCIALLIEGGKLVFRASNNGTGWNVVDMTTSLSLQANTNYYVKVEFNKLDYRVSYSLNGEDYTQIGYVVSTEFPRHGQVSIGVGNNQHNPFLGIINLNKAFIKLNHTIVWQGMDDVGLATRADLSLSNLDELGEARFSAKQDAIDDLETIRTNANLVSTKQDIISDLGTIRTNASSAKSTVDTHVANTTIHVTASDKVAWSNKGTYSKPSTGIPKTDLASAVQTSLGKADTALQSISSSDVTTALGFTPYNATNPNGYTSNTGTITEIKMNGASKGTSGVVDLGTVITAHQSLANYATKTELNNRHKISIQSNAAPARYYKLCDIPKTSDGNFGNIIINGRLGTYASSGAPYYSIMLMNRYSILANVYCNGSDTQTSVDLVLYKQSDDSLKLYMKCNGWFVVDFIYEITQYTFTYDGTYIETVPSGEEVWKLSTAKKLVVDTDNTLKVTKVQADLDGTATKATQDASGNVITSTYAKKSDVVEVTNLKEVPVIIESWIDPDSGQSTGYRIWSHDGIGYYCEQWGKITPSVANKSTVVPLYKAFKTPGLYNVFTTGTFAAYNQYSCNVSERTSYSFTVWNHGISDVLWIAKGYILDSEVGA